MDKVKENGRNDYLLFDVTLLSQYKKRLDIESSIDFALEKNVLSLVFQPIYNLQTNKALGMEVLVRWTHPTFGNYHLMYLFQSQKKKGLQFK